MTDAPTSFLAVAIGLVPAGVNLLFADASSGSVDTLPWEKVTGTAALVVALGAALKYMAAREVKAQDTIKNVYEARVESLVKDKERLESRCSELENRLMDAVKGPK